jgi:hypothetical protein
VMTLFIYFRTRKSKSEMAFITGSTPEWGYEKSSVKDMLQSPFLLDLYIAGLAQLGQTEDIPSATVSGGDIIGLRCYDAQSAF